MYSSFLPTLGIFRWLFAGGNIVVYEEMKKHFLDARPSCHLVLLRRQREHCVLVTQDASALEKSSLPSEPA